MKKKEAEVTYDEPDQTLPDAPAPDQALPGPPPEPDQGLPDPPPEPDHALPRPPIDYTRPVLIEGADGGEPVEGPISVQHQERKFTYAGVHYEHVSDTVDGQWIYRPMP